MPINKLSRQQLELINRRTLGYPLQVAEKDYYLALAVHLVYNSDLGDKLVFKGGFGAVVKDDLAASESGFGFVDLVLGIFKLLGRTTGNNKIFFRLSVELALCLRLKNGHSNLRYLPSHFFGLNPRNPGAGEISLFLSV